MLERTKKHASKKIKRFLFKRVLLPMVPLILSVGLFVIILAPVLALLTTTTTVAAGSGKVTNKGLSAKVLGFEPLVRQITRELGIEDETPYLLAIMETESHGEGNDPMQAGESANAGKNGMADPASSIRQGVTYYKAIYDMAAAVGQSGNKKGIVQAYNFGSRYITWLPEKGKTHSIDEAENYSRNVVAPALGNTSGAIYSYVNPISTAVGKTYLYRNGGNFLYAELVFQYIQEASSSGGGSGGNEGMVSVALEQVGNVGGQKFWSWYGYPGRVEWCATFVSWVANQNGYIESGAVLKFAYCPTGVNWFKEKGQWLDGGGTPNPGDIIFFDWEPDGVSDHVGIVVRVEGDKVKTMEGNTGDMAAEREYPLNSNVIVGYGQPKY